MIKEMIKDNESFIGQNPLVFFSPGRVNVIGEHIDYHGGNVFPAAIELGIYAFVKKRDDASFKVNSLQTKKGIITIDPTDLAYDEDRDWANFVSGMMDACFDKAPLKGLNILFYSTLPSGSGLSSSAALEVLVGEILNTVYDLKIDRLDLVQIAQRVENHYINVNCGIMDQFAVGLGKKDHAIYLNTETLEYELVPFKLEGYKMVVANTNKKRQLADSKYNERVSECQIALGIIQENYKHVAYLSQLQTNELNAIQTVLDNDLLFRRVRHVITETSRTNDAVHLLKNGEIDAFGQSLIDSHQSLKDDYEVSCFELDQLVTAFLDEGAIGARMTGAGFGGCIVAIVPASFDDNHALNIKIQYRKQTGLEADIYIANPSDGTKQLSEGEW
jgi:galactokinase